MNTAKKIGYLLALMVALTGINTQASAAKIKCPESPNQVNLNVTADVSFDSATQVYTYSYIVKNDISSKQEVDGFSVDYTSDIFDIVNPAGWTNALIQGRSTLDWSATEVSDDIATSTAVPPSIVQIKPGDMQAGFSFKSRKGSGGVIYYATGFVPLPVGETEEEAELIAENCPQINQKMLDQAAVGITQGPSDKLAVLIDIKPGSSNNAINPGDQGVIPVAILGQAGFDVTDVNQSSVRLGRNQFGQNQAKPQNNKGHLEDVNRDGIFDLVFQFPTKDTGVQCQDGSLILTGQTKSAKPILGVDSISTAGC